MMIDRECLQVETVRADMTGRQQAVIALSRVSLTTHFKTKYRPIPRTPAGPPPALATVSSHHKRHVVAVMVLDQLTSDHAQRNASTAVLAQQNLKLGVRQRQDGLTPQHRVNHVRSATDH